jgi:uncharacterized membrane protein YfcA
MQIGVDWVSMGIFLVAFAISRVNAISLRLRYVVLAAACGAITAYRLQAKVKPEVFTWFALALAGYYVFRAIGARSQPRGSHGDDD